MALKWQGKEVALMTQRERMDALGTIAGRLDAMRRETRRNSRWHDEQKCLEHMRDAIVCASKVEWVWRTRLRDPTLPPEVNTPVPQRKPKSSARRARC
jgi:hypothetical protein